MRKIIPLLFALSPISVIPAAALEQQVSKASYPLPPAGRLAVENVQGDIRVEGWDRAEVELTATKTALSFGSRLDAVRIAVEFGREAITFRTLHFGQSEEPVRVDYRLRVPWQVRLDSLRTVEGDIAVQNVEGFVDASSLNGNIQQENFSGQGVARTVNGNIAISLRSLPGGKASLRLEAINGNLDLILPPKANADLELYTVAGKIEGKYVFVASDVPGDSTRRARLGRGGALVQLRTVRGNIRIAERQELL